MKKKHINLILKFIFLMPLAALAKTNISSQERVLQNSGDISPSLIVSIFADDKKKFFFYKGDELKIIRIDAQILNSQDNKWFNDLFNESKKPSSSLLYEFNFTDDKSDNIFQFFPFLNNSQGNNGQSPRNNMITLFQFNLF